MNERPDVVVIGGGAAGLAAAERLARGGAVVAVVEARPRLGGRVDTRRIDGWPAPLERGAEFVHGRPPALLDLAEEAQATIDEAGGAFLCRGPDGLDACDERFAAAAAWLKRLGGARAPGGDDGLRAPDADGGADGGRDVSVREALDRAAAEGTAPDRALVEAFVAGYYLADPATVSARFVGHEEGGEGDPARDFQGRVREGYDRVLAPLAHALGMGLVDVRVGRAVRAVAWSPGSVALTLTGEGDGDGHERETLRARAAVITVPLGVLAAPDGAEGAIAFEPPLAEKIEDARRLQMGPVVKVHLRFRRPLWPQGAGFLMDPEAAFPTFWTPRPGAPMLTGWAGGARAEAVAGRPAGMQVATAVASLARILDRRPADVLPEVEGAQAVDWSQDPFARGGYMVVPAGAWDAWRRLADPVEDTLFFAGEATSRTRQSGTVHGALETGRRAAEEALAALGRRG